VKNVAKRLPTLQGFSLQLGLVGCIFPLLANDITLPKRQSNNDYHVYQQFDKQETLNFSGLASISHSDRAKKFGPPILRVSPITM
jgi:hypothetical protein